MMCYAMIHNVYEHDDDGFANLYMSCPMMVNRDNTVSAHESQFIQWLYVWLLYISLMYYNLMLSVGGNACYLKF